MAFRFDTIIPSPADARDWKYGHTTSNVCAAAPIAPAPTATPPATLDLRPSLYPVRNQGQEGACAGFSSAAMREWQERGVCLSYFAPDFIYWNRPDTTQTGMCLRDVMNILLKTGVCPESDCPYGTISATSNISKTAYSDALNHKITGYAQVTSQDDLKAALIADGPNVIVFPVYNNGSAFWKPATDNQAIVGYHAVAVVGYDQYGYLIRNSWGPTWNHNGYTTYPYADWGSHTEIWSTVSATPAPVEVVIQPVVTPASGCLCGWF